MILKVDPFQESLNQGRCGPASLKIILNYFGHDISEDELARLTKVDQNQGCSDSDIKHAAESLGYSVEIHNNSSLTDIESWLGRGIPVIVNWFTRGRSDYDDSAVPDGHYSVVVGIDKENIYLQDPEIGAMRTIKRDDFLRVWFDFTTDHITQWEDMIVRQIIAVYPKEK